MNGCCDVVTLTVSWVVDVFDHGEHIHKSSIKNSTCEQANEALNEAKKGLKDIQCLHDLGHFKVV